MSFKIPKTFSLNLFPHNLSKLGKFDGSASFKMNSFPEHVYYNGPYKRLTGAKTIITVFSYVNTSKGAFFYFNTLSQKVSHRFRPPLISVFDLLNNPILFQLCVNFIPVVETFTSLKMNVRGKSSDINFVGIITKNNILNGIIHCRIWSADGVYFLLCLQNWRRVWWVQTQIKNLNWKTKHV